MTLSLVALFRRILDRIASRHTGRSHILAWSSIMIGMVALGACVAPPTPPIGVAVMSMTEVPTATAAPTDIPTVTLTPTHVPTATPAPTETPAPTAVPTATPAPVYDLVLTGATLFDASGAPPLANAALAIRGNRIVRIATTDTLEYGPTTRVIELAGATILPGFINTHVHTSGRGDDELRQWTRAGVTTLRDLAGPLEWVTSTRDRLANSDDPTFPRLLVAGPIISVENGYPLSIHDHALRVEGIAVHNVDDARATVTMLADAGVDVIKIAVSGRTDVHWPELSDPEIAAITTLAHERGLLVSAHVDRSNALRRAILNGVDSAAHSPRDRIPDDVIRLMVERGITMSPTIGVYEDLARMRGSDAAWRTMMLPVMYDNLRRFVAAGGILALGDDYGGVPNMPIGMPMAELYHWQAAGLTPQQIIEASTRNSALAIGREHDLGTVEVGKVADLLVVQGNPLKDLGALARPVLVVHNGMIVEP